jgi:uncharacterized metal-binding protein YceD (DUF177 family)
MPSVLHFPLTEVKEKGESQVNVIIPSDAFLGLVEAGELITPIGITGLISEQDNEIIFAGDARGRWRIECTRCLTPVEEAYIAPVVHRLPMDEQTMDLTDEVRQAIVLAQPMKIYCRPDCKGLCVVCRTNRNTKDCGHAQSSQRGKNA